MVTIIKPGSAYIKINTDDSTLKWSSDESSQTSYEIMYKLKSETAWNTCGVVSSTSESYDLSKLYTLAQSVYDNIDLVEISYKVKCYYDSISDESNIYTVIFSNKPVNYINIYNKGTTSKYPLFDSIKNSDIDSLNVFVNNKTLVTPLVEKDSVLASNVFIRVPDGSNRTLMKSYVDISSDVTYNDFPRYTYGEASYLVPEYTTYYYISSSYSYSYISKQTQYSYANYYTYYKYNTTGYNSYQTYYSYYAYYTYTTNSYASTPTAYAYYYYYSRANKTDNLYATYTYAYTSTGSTTVKEAITATGYKYVTPYITAYTTVVTQNYNATTNKTYYVTGYKPVYGGGNVSYTYTKGYSSYSKSYSYTAYGTGSSVVGTYKYYATLILTNYYATAYKYYQYTTSNTIGYNATAGTGNYLYYAYNYVKYNSSGINQVSSYSYAYYNTYAYAYKNNYSTGYNDISYYEFYLYKYHL